MGACAVGEVCAHTGAITNSTAAIPTPLRRRFIALSSKIFGGDRFMSGRPCSTSEEGDPPSYNNGFTRFVHLPEIGGWKCFAAEVGPREFAG